MLPTSPTYAFALKTCSHNHSTSDRLTKFEVTCGFGVLSYDADVVVLVPFVAVWFDLIKDEELKWDDRIEIFLQWIVG